MTDLERKAQEAAERYRKDSITNGDHPVSAGAYAGSFHDGYLAAAKEAEQEIVALRARVAEITRAVIAYRKSEGCGCCCGNSHSENRGALGRAIGAPMYLDGSGYDFDATPIPPPEGKP